MAKTIEERFWAKVEKAGPDDCWIWSGRKTGTMGYAGFKYKNTQVGHRASWMMTNGDIPEGMLCLHKCDTTICVNPNHLFLGTHKDNMVDMANKNRVGGKVKKGKHWVFLTPSGEKLETTNLAQFAREHGLCHRGLRRLSFGQDKFHRGYSLLEKDGVPL